MLDHTTLKCKCSIRTSDLTGLPIVATLHVIVFKPWFGVVKMFLMNISLEFLLYYEQFYDYEF